MNDASEFKHPDKTQQSRSPQFLPERQESATRRESEESARAIETAADAEGVSLRKQTPLGWLATLLGPPAAVILLLILVGLVGGSRSLRHLAVTMLATFFFFGRFIILAGSDPETAEYRKFFSSEQLALLVFFMDAMTAILVAFHMNLLFRLPVLGKRLRLLTLEGEQLVRSQPWMRRTTFIGVVVFVMLPLASTGSIGGALLGRLLGLPRLRTFAAVIVGSASGCLFMYYGADLINRYFDRNDPRVTGTAFGLVVALILLLNWRYRKLRDSSA